ncbi:hypothetical protein EON66_10525, partial [archaeon]
MCAVFAGCGAFSTLDPHAAEPDGADYEELQAQLRAPLCAGALSTAPRAHHARLLAVCTKVQPSSCAFARRSGDEDEAPRYEPAAAMWFAGEATDLESMGSLHAA